MKWPLESIVSLEVARGRKSHIVAGAIGGLLTGAAAGLIYGAAYDDEICSRDCVIAFSGMGALGGVAVGSLIALAVRTDHWEQVPLE